MIFELHLHKADMGQGYLIFGPAEQFRPVLGGAAQESAGFPRPKLTLDIEQWEGLGKPTTLSLDVWASTSRSAD